MEVIREKIEKKDIMVNNDLNINCKGACGNQ